MIIETARKNDYVIITDNQNSMGSWESRLYVEDGNEKIASHYICASHKTLNGAKRWALNKIAEV
ncbi:hypothetical protein [Raoultella ornithinolytica]|uniref:hypothetical protein n=1 Tax=Raoultella ornithinolytica TaxID=54291 RepID=UPI000FEC063C|nr:hypothetical protein [Raoultella ornithinolytica]RWT88910.1 hypothetical protein DN602_30270 [Raoultella ornithinolytica]